MDPLTLGAMALGGLAAGGATAALSGGGAQAPTALTVPQQTPAPKDPLGTKPKPKSSTPSFLAGSSLLPGAGSSTGATGGGKSLLGQ